MAQSVFSGVTTVVILTSLDEFIALNQALQEYVKSADERSKYCRIAFNIINALETAGFVEDD